MSPTSLAVLLRLLLALYFPFLALVCLLTAGLIAWLVGFAFDFFLCGMYTLPPAILLLVTLLQVVVTLPALRMRPPDRDELELPLPRKHVPALYEWVYEIARQGRMRAPREVRLAMDGIASVYETELGHEVLVLGGPAVAFFSQQALAGIVAHELGHFAAGDTRLSRRAFGRAVVMAILNARFDAQHGSWINPIVWLIRGYHLLYRLTQAAHSRHQEYAADRYLLAQSGRDTAAAALIHTIVTDRFPWVRLSSVAESAVATEQPLKQAFTEQLRRAQEVRPWEWEDACRKELAEPTGLFDSHPALKDRLKALGVSPRKALKLALDQTGPPARDLFPDWDRIEEQLTTRLISIYQMIHQEKMELGRILRRL